MDLRHGLIRLAPVFLLAAGSAPAQTASFAISQAYPQLPVLTGYLDIVDPSGQPIPGIQPADLSVTLGNKPLTVTGVVPFDNSAEGVGYIFLIDISKSIRPAQFSEMKAAITTWIDGMKGNDQAAIGLFGESYRLAADFTNDKEKLKSVLNPLAPAENKTLLFLAIDRAMELAERRDEGLPNRRVIVVLTDGKDEGSGVTIEDLLRKVHKGQPVYVRSPLPVYAIGFSTLPPRERPQYLANLQRIASLTGGVYREGAAASLAKTYQAMQQAIRRVYVAKFACSGCRADGRSYPLEVTFKWGATVSADRITVVPIAPPAEPWWRTWWLWALVAVALIGMAAAAVVLWQRNQKPKAPDVKVVGVTPRTTGGAVGVGVAVVGVEVRPVAASGGLRITLSTVVGKDPGRTQELRLVKTLKIGRGADCDVVVSGDKRVSNQHCEMALINGQVVIYDLQSTNATIVNGVPITGRQKLDSRDSIRVGQTEFRVHFGERP